MEQKEQKQKEILTTLAQVKTVIANVKAQLAKIEDVVADAELCKSEIAKNTLTVAACKLTQKIADVI